MRMLFALMVLMSFSSCVAFLGIGALTTAISVPMGKMKAREGRAREAKVRLLHAQEAAVIRQRYNEAERRDRALRGPMLEADLSAPPLVSLDPIRKPLRSRTFPP